MNTPQIKAMCNEIYRDYVGMGRKTEIADANVLTLIFRLYNITEIDYEEVKFLWTKYLKTGNLPVSDAIQMARQRIADWNDIKETEDELIHWLHGGI